MAGNPRSNPVTDEDIIAAYNERKSGRRTAEHLGIGETTVYRVLLRHGVERPGLREYRERITRFKGQEGEIRAWYDGGETLDQIRERLGGASDYSIKHAIRRAGGTLRDNPAPLVKEGEVEAVRRMNGEGLGQPAISIALGRSQSFIGRLMRRNGIATLRQDGTNHRNWKGGRYKDSNGYIRVWMAPDDPLRVMCLNDNTVLEHRLVMARHLGRPLTRAETIHHISGDKTDNRIENLQLRNGRHGKGVALCCADCGSRNIVERTLD